MNILLDTHAFLWLMTDDKRLSEKARNCFQRGEDTCYLSSISAWEIAQKYYRKKLQLPRLPEHFISEACAAYEIAALPFSSEDCHPLPRLPKLHNDPFDRMLICQAIARGLTILTADAYIQCYPVSVYW